LARIREPDWESQPFRNHIRFVKIVKSLSELSDSFGIVVQVNIAAGDGHASSDGDGTHQPQSDPHPTINAGVRCQTQSIQDEITG